MDDGIPSIASTCDGDNFSRPPSVIERYFQRRYRTDFPNVGEDQMVLTHSNRICVICLSPEHPVVKDKKTVTSVDFRVDGVDRLSNKVSGKSKRGAQWLTPDARLCTITCSDASQYTPTCCIRGHLIEVNTNLTSNPGLLTQKSNGNNYIAVILPVLKTYEQDIHKLTSHDDYRKFLEDGRPRPSS